ncbi:MAG: nucleotidyltransferase family protein [Gaiellales bacterium]
MVSAVVLAAGAATRFGGPKQQLLLPRVLERLAASPVDEVVVVAGAYELEAEGARVVECPEWERGRGASLRCGLAALEADVEAAVVCLADGPNLVPESVARVLAAWRVGAGAIVAACYAGNRGHPVAVGRRAWDAVPDEGLHPLPATLVPCDDLGPPGDVDAADDIKRLHPPLAEN